MDRSSANATSSRLKDSIVGCILGTAVGDAVGLCGEGMSRRRLRRYYPDLDGPRFFFGKGMTSDDTEHTCMVAQSLIVAGGDAAFFLQDFSWRLRYWLLGLPAGIGRATLRAIVKLWLGFPPERSGVFSAGNGPAMRSALLGICHGQDLQSLRAWVWACTRVTHSDPKAAYGAFAIALAARHAHCSQIINPREFLHDLCQTLGAEAEGLFPLIRQALASAAAGEATETFAAALGLEEGVSGYTYHTVPVALQAWLRHSRDYRAAVLDVVRCGGDTDTMAAIVGALVGCGVGMHGIPSDWLEALGEWPRSVSWMELLGERLASVCRQGKARPALPLFVPGLLARNLFFLAIVLLHALRRLGPPY